MVGLVLRYLPIPPRVTSAKQVKHRPALKGSIKQSLEIQFVPMAADLVMKPPMFPRRPARGPVAATPVFATTVVTVGQSLPLRAQENSSITAAVARSSNTVGNFIFGS